MDRKEIRKLFREHRGAGTETARRANVRTSAVSRWLSGEFVSANIERYAAEVARDLTAKKNGEWLAANRGALSKIARDLKCSRAFVRDVYLGRRRSRDRQVERALARMGAPVKELTTNAA